MAWVLPCVHDGVVCSDKRIMSSMKTVADTSSDTHMKTAAKSLRPPGAPFTFDALQNPTTFLNSYGITKDEVEDDTAQEGSLPLVEFLLSLPA